MHNLTAILSDGIIINFILNTNRYITNSAIFNGFSFIKHKCKNCVDFIMYHDV
jgi:hypothetical protein